MQNRSRRGFAVAASRRHGIIASNPPLARLRVCIAHAPVPARRALRIRRNREMTKDELLALCAAYPGAAVDCPFEDGGNVVVRHAAGRKWFALVFERDGKLCVNLKCEPMKADFWRAAYPAVTPGWHMNHTHWNTVEVNAGVPPEDLCEMISDSYRLTTSPARAERSTRRAKQRPQP